MVLTTADLGLNINGMMDGVQNKNKRLCGEPLKFFRLIKGYFLL